jgi:hypothetical protein
VESRKGMPMLEFSSSRVRSGNLKPVFQPYEVRVDGSPQGAFEDVHDAISSAQIARQEHPCSLIAVADRATRELVVELAP